MSTTRFVLAALTLVVVVAAPAQAQGVPDTRNFTLDAVVVGNTSGTPMGGNPAGFDAVVRDVFNVPVSGHALILDFSATSIRLIAVQNSGTTLNCAARTVSRLSDAAGAVNIAARFGGFDNTDAVEVSMDGVVLGRVKARSTDLDGLDGRTGLGDFAIFGDNFLNQQGAQETDYDLSGTTSLGDFALFAAEFLREPPHPDYCP